MLAAAYDPSRDLSPNLPTTCQDSGGSMTSASSCCSFKTEPLSAAESYDPLSTRDCRDCHYDSREEESYCRRSCLQEQFRDRREYLPVEPKTEPAPAGAPGPPDEEDVVCAGCGRRIADRYYLFAVERRWHASCLQCCQCRRALDGEVTCFARDGNIYCKKDYYR